MVQIVHVIAFSWLTFCLVLSIVNISKRGRVHPVWFVFFCFYVFYALPLGTDVVFGPPSFSMFPGLFLASNDTWTQLIYSFYACMVPVIWYIASHSSRLLGVTTLTVATGFKPSNHHINYSRLIKVLLNIVLWLPVVIVIFSPDPKLYVDYAVNIKGVMSKAQENYHQLVGITSYLSVIAAACLMFLRKRHLILYTVYFLLPFLFFDVWVQGKRSIVFLVVASTVFVLWQKGILRGFRLIIFVTLAIVGLSAFSVVYQKSLRADIVGTGFEAQYNNISVDYARAQMVQLSIYAELHPGQVRILDYPAESFLFDATFYVPRKMWPQKPYPYAVYATGAAFLQHVRITSWGLTTGILDEFIANFGWVGALLGPLFVVAVCSIGNRRNTNLSYALTVLVGSMLLVLQFSAIIEFVCIWTCIMVLQRKARMSALINVEIPNSHQGLTTLRYNHKKDVFSRRLIGKSPIDQKQYR